MDMIDIVVDEFTLLEIQYKTLYLSIDLFVFLFFHPIYSSLLIPPCLTCDDVGPLVYTAAFWPGNNIIINNERYYYHYYFV
jgi:hypothetical protein